MSDQMTSTETAACMRDEPSLIHDERGLFAQNWNKAGFAYTHALANHSLFEPESLAQLAKRIPKIDGFVFWRNTKTALKGVWADGTDTNYSVEDTLRHLDDTDSIVILKHVEQDPEFGPLLQRYLADIVAQLAPEQADDVLMGEALIFANSPHRITHYHIDGECVFVAEIKGEKTFRVYDQTDRTVISLEEIEGYFGGNADAAKLRDENIDKSPDYHIRPGEGVHIPVNAPHWVKTGPQAAVSITFTFDLKSTQKLRRLHYFNDRLRRRGLARLPIGQAPVRDAAIDLGLRTLQFAKHRFESRPGDAYPVWTPHGVRPRRLYA